MMRMVGPALRAGLDPFWSKVVLLLQDGEPIDRSQANTSVVLNNATPYATAWTYNGLRSIATFGNNLSSSNSSVRFSIPNLGAQDWTIEGACRTTSTGAYMFADNLGNNVSGLLLQISSASTPPRLYAAVDNDNNPATGTITGQSANILSAFPWEGYWCAERKGRYIYLSANGVIVHTVDLGSASYSIAAPAYTPRFGQQSSVSAAWDMWMAMYRITLGAARYNGQSFTPPTGLFPVG